MSSTMPCWNFDAARASVAPPLTPDAIADIGSSGLGRYATTVTVSAVTPVDVAPPLSPSNGAKHGGTFGPGSAICPVSVSQRGPQSMSPVVPAASACCQVTTSGAGVLGLG